MSVYENPFQNGFYPGDDIVTGEVCETVRRVRRPWERLRVQSVPQGETRTLDSFVDQTDINKIIKRFDRTGYLPENTRVPQFGDVTGLQGDLTERINESWRIQAQAVELDAAAAQHREAAKAKANQPVPDIPANSVPNPEGDNPSQ